MKKLIISCFLFLGSITVSFGQEMKLELDSSETLHTRKFVIIIKDYEIMFEDSLQNGFQNMNIDWVKSIEVYKYAYLRISNGKNDTIVIKLKNRKWKKLPIHLKEAFENSTKTNKLRIFLD